MGGKAHFVRHHDHGHALGSQRLHDAQHLAHQFRVERGSRLVEQHQTRFHGDGAGDGDALLLAAGQARRVVGHLVGQSHLLQGLGGTGLGIRFRQAAHADQAFGDVLQRRHVRPQVELLEHHADRAAHLAQLAARHLAAAGRGVADQLPVDGDLAGIIFLEEVDAAQQRGLARAGRPDQARHLARLDGQVNFLQRLEGAVELGDLADLDG